MCRRDPTICRTDPPGHFNLTRNHGMIIVRVRSHFQDNIKGRDKIKKSSHPFRLNSPLTIEVSLSSLHPRSRDKHAAYLAPIPSGVTEGEIKGIYRVIELLVVPSDR